jgi:hypothetical protein
MSVINESQAGDVLVCMSEFSGPPHGEKRTPDNSRNFKVGERVNYVGFFRHPNLHDNPVCWTVLFDAADGKRYAATQTLFVTEEHWRNLQKHFARQRRQTKTGRSRSRAARRN